MANELPFRRRTVLKTVGAGVVGGTVLTGSASAHGGDHRVPSWFEGEIWEMAEYPPFGELEEESTAPIWTIAPAANGKTCPQMEDFDLGIVEESPLFADGEWGSVDFDHTLSENPFSSLWHVHFVFDGTADSPYVPEDLINTDQDDNPLTDGTTIRNATNATEVSVPFAFNCPIRPADEEHENYCE